jgi:UDP-glucose 6-dehydrogenase
LEEERHKRNAAEKNVQKRNQWLLQGSIIAMIIFSGLAITAFVFAIDSDKQKIEALNQKTIALNQAKIADVKAKEALKNLYEANRQTI